MKSHIVVFVIFVLLTIFLTFPLAFSLDSHLAGYDTDVWINPWANWWSVKAIKEGLNLYFTDYLFYPQGISLVFHSFSPLNTLFWWLLEPMCGSTIAYNLTIMLAYVLSGYGMWQLVRYLTGNPYAGFIAGIIFAFSPYQMIEGAHPVISSTQWIPFFVLYLIKTLRNGRMRDGLVGGFFLGLTAWSSLHLFTFSVLLAALYIGYTALFNRDLWSRKMVVALSVLVLLSLVALAPLVYPVLQEQLAGGVSYFAVDLKEGVGNHLWGFFLPTAYHPLYGKLFEGVNLMMGISSSRPSFLGFSVLILGLHAALKGGKKTRFWVIGTVIFMFLSIGPYLPLRSGKLVWIPWSGPVVALWRHPFRFNVLISFCFSILAAFDFSIVLDRLKRPQSSNRFWSIKLWTTLLLATLVLFEYLTLPYPLTELQVSPFYEQLAKKDEAFAVVEFPIGRQATKSSMYYQTIHGKKLASGVVSRTPINAFDYVAANALLDAAWKGNPSSVPVSSAVTALSDLSKDGIRYIILRKDLLEEDHLNTWQDLIQIESVYEDDTILVYPTSEHCCLAD